MQGVSYPIGGTCGGGSPTWPRRGLLSTSRGRRLELQPPRRRAPRPSLSRSPAATRVKARSFLSTMSAHVSLCTRLYYHRRTLLPDRCCSPFALCRPPKEFLFFIFIFIGFPFLRLSILLQIGLCFPWSRKGICGERVVPMLVL